MRSNGGFARLYPIDRWYRYDCGIPDTPARSSREILASSRALANLVLGGSFAGIE